MSTEIHLAHLTCKECLDHLAYINGGYRTRSIADIDWFGED